MNQENAIVYIIAYAIGVFLTICFTRLIFSIPKFLRYKRMEIKILIEIARVQGVPEERIETIKKSDEEL